jgi:hypothetical protein
MYWNKTWEAVAVPMQRQNTELLKNINLLFVKQTTQKRKNIFKEINLEKDELFEIQM